MSCRTRPTLVFLSIGSKGSFLKLAQGPREPVNRFPLRLIRETDTLDKFPGLLSGSFPAVHPLGTTGEQDVWGWRRRKYVRLFLMCSRV